MILVTGATGTNGRELIQQLASTAGGKLRAMVRDPRRAGSLGVELAAGDFDKPETFGPALKGIEKVFLLTNPDHLMTSRERAFLEAARAAGVKHVVRFSAMGSGAATPVLHMHGEADRQLADFGIPFTILQPNIFFQNMFMMADSIRKIGKFFHLAGTAAMSQIDVRDNAAFAARVLTTQGHEGRAYVLTGPQAITYAQIAKALSDALGRPIQFVPVTPAAQKQSMLDAGMPAATVDALISLFEYFEAGKAAAVSADFETVMGRSPRSFETFARDFAGNFR